MWIRPIHCSSVLLLCLIVPATAPFVESDPRSVFNFLITPWWCKVPRFVREILHFKYVGKPLNEVNGKCTVDPQAEPEGEPEAEGEPEPEPEGEPEAEPEPRKGKLQVAAAEPESEPRKIQITAEPESEPGKSEPEPESEVGSGSLVEPEPRHMSRPLLWPSPKGNEVPEPEPESRNHKAYFIGS